MIEIPGFKPKMMVAEGGPPFLYRPPTDEEVMGQWHREIDKEIQEGVDRSFWCKWNLYNCLL